LEQAAADTKILAITADVHSDRPKNIIKRPCSLKLMMILNDAS
jgi:hypothetical protein